MGVRRLLPRGAACMPRGAAATFVGGTEGPLQALRRGVQDKRQFRMHAAMLWVFDELAGQAELQVARRRGYRCSTS